MNLRTLGGSGPTDPVTGSGGNYTITSNNFPGLHGGTFRSRELGIAHLARHESGERICLWHLISALCPRAFVSLCERFGRLEDVTQRHEGTRARGNPYNENCPVASVCLRCAMN